MSTLCKEWYLPGLGTAILVDKQGNVKERREMEQHEIMELNSRLSRKITSYGWEWEIKPVPYQALQDIHDCADEQHRTPQASMREMQRIARGALRPKTSKTGER